MTTPTSPYLRLIQKTGATTHPYGMPATQDMLNRIGITNKFFVLDVGCGAGHSSAFIAKTYGCSVTGVDISPDVLQKAQALYGNEPYGASLRFCEANATSLPFPHEHFDVVMCESVLIFIDDKEAALCEMARVLKPGGYLLLNELCVSVNASDKLAAFFGSPEYQAHLVAADRIIDFFNQTTWRNVIQDEKPFDLKAQIYASLGSAVNFKMLLPMLEFFHRSLVDAELRADIMTIVKHMALLPKDALAQLNSLQIAAQKKTA